LVKAIVLTSTASKSIAVFSLNANLADKNTKTQVKMQEKNGRILMKTGYSIKVLIESIPQILIKTEFIKL
jgi:hypothetical protein